MSETAAPAYGEALSSVIGWTYFAAWSFSFYPQIFLNYKRKSVEGLSIDFLVYNVYGFACYAIFNTAFFFSREIGDEYARRNDGHRNLVRFNDLFFSYHALALSLVTFSQSFWYKRSDTQSASSTVRVFFLVTFAGLIASLLFASPYATVYYLSFIKLGCSMVKYIPQVWINYRRKSTAGWSIHNILLDFTGGVLSFTQLFMDAFRLGTVGDVLGNPVKLGLGMASIGFDLVFMGQHYVWFAEDRRRYKDIESQLDVHNQSSEYGSTNNSDDEGTAA